MQISLIAAMDRNRVIGKDNDIPWRIPKLTMRLKSIPFSQTLILKHGTKYLLNKELRMSEIRMLTNSTCMKE